MKRIFSLLVLVLALAGWASAETDIPVSWRGPVFDIGRNLVWGNSGLGGFNNAYIIQNVNPSQGTCVTMNNLNPNSSHTFSIKAFITSDQQLSGYYATLATMSWLPLPVLYPLFSNGSMYIGPVNSLDPQSFYIPAAGAGRLALVFSGGTTQTGSPDTVNIFGTQTASTNCGGWSPSGSYNFVFYQSGISSTTAVNLFGRQATNILWPIDPASFRACTFNASIVNTSGTSPTLNLYVQDTDAQISSFTNDRVSFVQATTGTSTQQASLALESTVAPAATKNGSLAAGSGVGGIFSDLVRLNIVPGGTSPVYTLTFSAHCH
jgi:hypothetical protein